MPAKKLESPNTLSAATRELLLRNNVALVKRRWTLTITADEERRLARYVLVVAGDLDTRLVSGALRALREIQRLSG